MSNEPPSMVQEIVQRVVLSCDPDCIMLFGSYAKQCAGSLSDVDLLVIKRSLPPSRRRGAAIRRLFDTAAVPVHLVFATPGEVEAQCRESHSLIHNIMRWGSLVYSRPDTVTRDSDRDVPPADNSSSEVAIPVEGFGGRE